MISILQFDFRHFKLEYELVTFDDLRQFNFGSSVGFGHPNTNW